METWVWFWSDEDLKKTNMDGCSNISLDPDEAV
jgi:hypothetical protein